MNREVAVQQIVEAFDHNRRAGVSKTKFVVASQQLGQGKTVLGENALPKFKSLVGDSRSPLSRKANFPAELVEAVGNAYYVKVDLSELGMSFLLALYCHAFVAFLESHGC